ncbi:MAG: TlpA disulfide reductase family protein [Acidimicrobiaceae bacterium]|nr:TlpA disulfide reductase family protein [Acidimicrobiaceae bacterium]
MEPEAGLSESSGSAEPPAGSANDVETPSGAESSGGSAGAEPSVGVSAGSPVWRRRAFWIAVPAALLVGLLVVVLATSDSALQRRATSPILGGLAPPIVGQTIDGEPFDLDDWRGRWVVVNFFQSTCVPCIIEHPELTAFDERHAVSGSARVVSVVFDDTAENVREFFAVHGGDWPVVSQGAGRAAVAYGVTGVPESYLVAPSGVVVWKQLGGVTADGIDDVISRLS